MFSNLKSTMAYRLCTCHLESLEMNKQTVANTLSINKSARISSFSWYFLRSYLSYSFHPIQKLLESLSDLPKVWFTTERKIPSICRFLQRYSCWDLKACCVRQNNTATALVSAGTRGYCYLHRERGWWCDCSTHPGFIQTGIISTQIRLSKQNCLVAIFNVHLIAKLCLWHLGHWNLKIKVCLSDKCVIKIYYQTELLFKKKQKNNITPAISSVVFKVMNKLKPIPGIFHIWPVIMWKVMLSSSNLLLIHCDSTVYRVQWCIMMQQWGIAFI